MFFWRLNLRGLWLLKIFDWLTEAFAAEANVLERCAGLSSEGSWCEWLTDDGRFRCWNWAFKCLRKRGPYRIFHWSKLIGIIRGVTHVLFHFSLLIYFKSRKRTLHHKPLQCQKHQSFQAYFYLTCLPLPNCHVHSSPNPTDYYPVIEPKMTPTYF